MLWGSVLLHLQIHRRRQVELWSAAYRNARSPRAISQPTHPPPQGPARSRSVTSTSTSPLCRWRSRTQEQFAPWPWCRGGRERCQSASTSSSTRSSPAARRRSSATVADGPTRHSASRDAPPAGPAAWPRGGVFVFAAPGQGGLTGAVGVNNSVSVSRKNAHG